MHWQEIILSLPVTSVIGESSGCGIELSIIITDVAQLYIPSGEKLLVPLNNQNSDNKEHDTASKFITGILMYYSTAKASAS